MENTTYTINLDSCEAMPKVVASFDEVPESKLKDALYYAVRAFRSVEVINNQTGEVVLTLYVGLALFEEKRGYNYGEALDYMHHIITRD